MADREFKDRLDAFKNSCRVYKHEKAMLDDQSSYKRSDFGDEKLLSYIKEDVDYVEGIFSAVETRYGKSARLMIWLLFVEEKTQVDVAAQFGISRRQLQYSLNKWLQYVLGQE